MYMSVNENYRTYLACVCVCVFGEIDDLRKEIEVVQRDFISHASTCVSVIRRSHSTWQRFVWVPFIVQEKKPFVLQMDEDFQPRKKKKLQTDKKNTMMGNDLTESNWNEWPMKNWNKPKEATVLNITDQRVWHTSY